MPNLKGAKSHAVKTQTIDLTEYWDRAAFWKVLNPELSLENESPIQIGRTYELDHDQMEFQLRLLKEDGYFDIQALLDEKEIDLLAQCVQRFHQWNLPTIFSFVYDDFWRIVQKLAPILSQFLGKDFLILQDVWTWYVDHDSQTNFDPHRDRPFTGFLNAKGLPTALTLWVPLTDVTTRHSCICVVPKSFDPHYPDPGKRYFRQKQIQFAPEELPNIRALPARKGSILGWNLGLMHWGSRCSSGASPRISVGYYIQSNSIKPLSIPVVDLTKPFPLKTRLGFIGRMIADYSRDREPNLMRMAEKLLQYFPHTS